MRLVVDMNLSPRWVHTLNAAGFEAAHWSQIGDATAPDTKIMEWALNKEAVVFTHDLDFSRLLALTQAAGPSVLQIRTGDISPQSAGPAVISALQRFPAELAAGALVVLDEHRQRIRILPLQR